MSSQQLRYGQCYHIYNRGNNRESLFVEEGNYAYFLRQYTKRIVPVAETFAYCPLPNHFHFAIRTRTEEEQEAYRRKEAEAGSTIGPVSPFQPTPPSRAFKNLFIAYTRAFNRATGRTGTLFERPFHRKRVDSLVYVLRLINYIHQNPQQHHLVDEFRDWKWSSYGAYCSTQPSNIQREKVRAWYGGQSGFLEAHNRDLTNLQDLSNLWEP